MGRTLGVAVVALFFATIVCTPRPSQALGIELEGRYWWPDLQGSAGLADLGNLELPPEVDVTRALELEADGVPEARFTFRIFLGFYVRAAYQTMSNSGERSFVDILNLPIPLAGTVNSSLDFDYGRLALGWRFVFPEKIFSIGAFAEAKGFSGDATASIDSTIFRASISESFEVVFGSVGGVVEINPGEKWQIFGELSSEVGYDDADMLDWELGLRYFPTKILGIGAGYRVMDLDGVVDNVVLDVDWEGAFLTALLKF